jgi:hypothetical protein
MVRPRYRKFHALVAKELTYGAYKVNALCRESEKLKFEPQYEGLRIGLQNILQLRFKNVRVHLYGSRFIGVATNESDLDIYVEIGVLKSF